jgi:cell envelope-related transcriptional attenuator
MEYLRFRKGYANQDLGRINAQQEFIQAVLEKSYVTCIDN